MLQDILSIGFLTTFLSAAIRMAIPMFYTALGETISERAGLRNIGLEDIMLGGAFFGFAVSLKTGSLALGFIGGMAGGGVFSMIHAFMSVFLRQDQTVSGIALNMFSLGITSYLFKVLVGSSTVFPQVTTLINITIPLLSKIPFVGEAFFNKDIITYLSYILILIVTVFMGKTVWGMQLKSVGENPRASDTVGIKVYRIQYLAALVNGMLGGLGGAYLILGQLGVFSENVTAGKGYISLAVVVFGKRSPIGVFLASVFFGAAEAFQFRLQNLGINLPTQIFTGLPYMLTVIALIIFAKKNENPNALGKPYVRHNR